jgi:hypothetical protein
MDPVTAPTEEIVQVDAVVDELDVTAPAAVPANPAPAEAVTLQINDVPAAGREYPSLYDSKGTTVVAILLGISIVAAIQFGIVRMYTTAKTDQAYLTRFVTALVGLVMGAYIADLLIAGPSTNLLSDADHTLILSFIKDIALMIFAYYFGTRSSVKSSEE